MGDGVNMLYLKQTFEATSALFVKQTYDMIASHKLLRRVRIQTSH